MDPGGRFSVGGLEGRVAHLAAQQVHFCSHQACRWIGNLLENFGSRQNGSFPRAFLPRCPTQRIKRRARDPQPHTPIPLLLNYAPRCKSKSEDVMHLRSDPAFQCAATCPSAPRRVVICAPQDRAFPLVPLRVLEFSVSRALHPNSFLLFRSQPKCPSSPRGLP